MSTATTATAPGTPSRYTLFPPIPAPLQRLFDLVPLVTYPANVLPDEDDGSLDDGAKRLPTLYVFCSPEDAVRGRPSFNPTCLKWQTYLRLAGVPVRLQPSSNHASPSGALPFLLPPRSQPTPEAAVGTTLPSPPIYAHELAAYASQQNKAAAAALSSHKHHPRAPAYQALLDTRLRRAWLHAVYLNEADSAGPIAGRLYADPASSSRVVRAALTRQLRAAAATEVWGAGAGTGMGVVGAGAGGTGGARSQHETAQIYREAQTALQALAALLEDNAFFFGGEPTEFDAAVFAYTNLLLEDDDGTDAARFRWQDRTLPDAVRALPVLVQHRQRILERCWPELASRQDSPISASPAPMSAPGVADSVSWVKV